MLVALSCNVAYGDIRVFILTWMVKQRLIGNLKKKLLNLLREITKQIKLAKHLNNTPRSLDLQDMTEFRKNINGGYKCILIVIDNFSKYGWGIPLENKKLSTNYNRWIF